METLNKESLLVWIDELAKINQLSQAFFALDHVRKEIKKGTFDMEESK